MVSLLFLKCGTLLQKARQSILLTQSLNGNHGLNAVICPSVLPNISALTQVLNILTMP